MKIKQFGLVATLFLGALMLSGCGNQNSSKSESHPKTTVKATKSKSTKTKKKTLLIKNRHCGMILKISN
ncbi:hypothetical protein [Companilactobacillus farciminis]|jgi:hypothetical protein|uniref:hypothetical protein n=1 Tax=Companilactobacillus farciminis TaxID=1612 RepID=UPI0002197293|nr:hypothetical protein [Companilactobacillus farciminis]